VLLLRREGSGTARVATARAPADDTAGRGAAMSDDDETSIMELDQAADAAFENLKTAIDALSGSGEYGVDAAVNMLQDILWWVLGQGVRDDGPNAGYLVTLR